MLAATSWKWESTEHQQFLALHHGKFMFWSVVDIHLTNIGCLYWEKLQRLARCRVLGISVNAASTIFNLESWLICFLIGCRHPFIKYWQPLLAKTTTACSLPHSENERQWSVNSFSCCIVRNQGITLISAFIMELFSSVVDKNTMYQRYNTDSKFIDIASCKAWKYISLVVENVILIRYYSHTPKARALIECMAGPTGELTDDPPNSDGMGVYYQTVPELTVQVYWSPGTPIWQRFRLDPDPDPEWRSATIANTTYDPCTHTDE